MVLKIWRHCFLYLLNDPRTRDKPSSDFLGKQREGWVRSWAENKPKHPSLMSTTLHLARAGQENADMLEVVHG